MAKLNCFVIMPFRREFDPVFDAVQGSAQHAVPGEEVRCHWLKDVQAAGRITDDIVTSLRECDICIADVTACNANVMWETGYAMALGKPTILIGQKLEELPFDLKVHRVIDYNAARLDDFAKRLAEAVRQTLAHYEIKAGAHVAVRAQTGQQAIVVTGSSGADRARTARRVDALLRPYLRSGGLWYCGSSGLVDELAVEYLLSHGERVVAVAYHRYDFSEGVRRFVEAGKLEFLDASVESLPKGMDGPSERDIFFCLKADLVVLFWDGNSSGTERLSSYLRTHGKNVLLGFI